MYVISLDRGGPFLSLLEVNLTICDGIIIENDFTIFPSLTYIFDYSTYT